MRLSEAIRLGATMRPQGFGRFATAQGTCALGAACEAMGFQFTNLDASSVDFAMANLAAFQMMNQWTETIRRTNESACPSCGATFKPDDSPQLGLIAHLNDSPHNWTREQIADFVELHEPLDEPKPITSCDHGKTWNCGQCAWLDNSQLNEELFDRSVFQAGVPLED